MSWRIRLIIAACVAVLVTVIWVIKSSLGQPPSIMLWFFILLSPIAIFSILRDWLGKTTINISPKTLEYQLHIGAIKFIDNHFDVDLLSELKAQRRKWPFHSMYSIRFLYGYKPTKINLGYLEAETRFVITKIEDALDSA